jgi:quercetin dioxygenase-like cupin family protein
MSEEHGDQVHDSSPGASRNPKRGGRSIEAPVLSFSLPTEVEQLRQQPSYANSEPSGIVLVRQPDLRIVLMALRAGARLQEHKASGPISIQVIEGQLRVSLSADSFALGAGQLLALDSDCQHSVEATENCAFLLTIGRTTYWHDYDPYEQGKMPFIRRTRSSTSRPTEAPLPVYDNYVAQSEPSVRPSGKGVSDTPPTEAEPTV